jgi:hypothetical protein
MDYIGEPTVPGVEPVSLRKWRCVAAQPGT